MSQSFPNLPSIQALPTKSDSLTLPTLPNVAPLSGSRRPLSPILQEESPSPDGDSSMEVMPDDKSSEPGKTMSLAGKKPSRRTSRFSKSSTLAVRNSNETATNEAAGATVSSSATGTSDVYADSITITLSPPGQMPVKQSAVVDIADGDSTIVPITSGSPVANDSAHGLKVGLDLIEVGPDPELFVAQRGRSRTDSFSSGRKPLKKPPPFSPESDKARLEDPRVSEESNASSTASTYIDPRFSVSSVTVRNSSSVDLSGATPATSISSKAELSNKSKRPSRRSSWLQLLSASSPWKRKRSSTSSTASNSFSSASSNPSPSSDTSHSVLPLQLSWEDSDAMEMNPSPALSSNPNPGFDPSFAKKLPTLFLNNSFRSSFFISENSDDISTTGLRKSVWYSPETRLSRYQVEQHGFLAALPERPDFSRIKREPCDLTPSQLAQSPGFGSGTPSRFASSEEESGGDSPTFEKADLADTPLQSEFQSMNITSTTRGALLSTGDNQKSLLEKAADHDLAVKTSDASLVSQKENTSLRVNQVFVV
eukprot:gb/GEZN01005373.1/.p1 GENE.gb/GEZN01005373.1/~~gb/GEZN01005373.1/.p1  ORF type:complete len:572 (-),score=65.10 gb/GEZN01005373.1/:98-1711(-)